MGTGTWTSCRYVTCDEHPLLVVGKYRNEVRNDASPGPFSTGMDAEAASVDSLRGQPQFVILCQISVRQPREVPSVQVL